MEGSMTYEEALKHWGCAKLEIEPTETNLAAIRVETYFDEGYACCGGSDPSCYCSFAESPTAEFRVYGPVPTDTEEYYPAPLLYRIDMEDFDFATVLKEIVEASGGIDGTTT